MPLTRIERNFKKEYGKCRGTNIFYRWENKHPELIKSHSNKVELVLTGDKTKLQRMKSHLQKEHPSTRGHLFLKYHKGGKYV